MYRSSNSYTACGDKMATVQVKAKPGSKLVTLDIFSFIHFSGLGIYVDQLTHVVRGGSATSLRCLTRYTINNFRFQLLDVSDGKTKATDTEGTRIIRNIVPTAELTVSHDDQGGVTVCSDAHLRTIKEFRYIVRR
jgi:hypothetical protein